MKYLHIYGKSLMLLISFIIQFNILAQDGHYWTENFGTRSMLLNGVVIGSVEDLGAVYYNPARISQFETPTFVISAKVYQYNRLRIENGLGDNIDLNKSEFGGGPSLVSGTFKLKFLKDHKFAYAFLTRSRYDQEFDFSVNTFGDFVESTPGEEYFSGEISINKKMREEWIGLSWSYALNEKLSVGLSTFYSALEQNTNLRIQLQAYSQDSTTGIYSTRRAYSLVSQSMVAKAGLGWQSDKLSLGLTITTPKWQVRGDGSINLETFLAGIDTTGNGQPDDIYGIHDQSGLDVKSRTPLAIGVGAGYRIGSSLIHVSAEWYDKVPRHILLQSEPFVVQSSGRIVRGTVVDDLQSVINFGWGIEVFATENLIFIGSFAADYSAVKKDIERFSELSLTTSNTVFGADIFHFGFGTSIKTKFADITIGATYATSKENVDRTIEINEGDVVSDKTSRLIFSRWRFMVGFSFPDKSQKKLQDQEEKIDDN